MTAEGMATRSASRTFTGAVVGITLLNLTYFIAYLCYFPTLPFFIKALNGRESEIGLAIAISSLTSLLLRPFVGYLVDTVGRKPLVIAGISMFAATALLYNLVHTTQAVLALRMLTGASMATFVTASSAYIADVARPDRRGSVMAYYGLANSLAFAIAPALGGFIIHTDLLAGFDSNVTGQADWLAGARTGDQHFTTLFLFTAALTAGAALIALLVLPSTGVKVAGRRIDPRDLFSRSALFPASVNFGSSTVVASMTSFMPLLAREKLGLANPGILFTVYGAVVIICRLSLGRLMDRLPREAFIIPGIFAMAACGFTLALATNVPMLYAAAAFYGLGSGTMGPAMMAYVVDRSDPTQRGRALSTFTLGSDLGLSAGAFSLGLISDWTGRYDVGFTVTGLVAATGGVAFVIHSLQARAASRLAASPDPIAAQADALLEDAMEG